MRDTDRHGRHHDRDRDKQSDRGNELGEHDRTPLPALPRIAEADTAELGGHGALLVRITFRMGTLAEIGAGIRLHCGGDVEDMRQTGDKS